MASKKKLMCNLLFLIIAFTTPVLGMHEDEFVNAAQKGDLNLIYRYLDRENINGKDRNGHIALIEAALNNCKDVVKFLIEKHADINIVDSEGFTALMKSINAGNQEMINFLLDNGADIFVKNSNNMTALSFARECASEEVYNNILKRNLDKIVIHSISEAKNNSLDDTFYDCIVKFKNMAVNAKNNSGKTALMLAIENKNYDLAKYLINNGAEINSKDSDGKTALMSAVEKGKDDLVDLLIKKGAKVNDKNSNGETALILGAEAHSCYSNTIKMLLENGADIDATTNSGNTALMLAAREEDKDVLAEILIKDYFADITIKNNEGKTALNIAKENENNNVIDLLEDQKLITIYSGIAKDMLYDPSQKKKDMVLIWASQKGTSAMVDILLEDINNIRARKKLGYTELMIAIEKEDINAVKCLLKRNVDVNAKNKCDGTALMIAAEKGNEEIVNLLIKNGARVDIKDNNGFTALTIAVLNGHSEIVNCLIENHAASNIESGLNNVKLTPLMWATINNRENVVDTLLSYNTNINVRAQNGRTALMYASEKGYTNLVKSLINHDANLNIQDGNLNTALMYAAENNNIDVIKLLLKNGVVVNSKNAAGNTAQTIAYSNNHNKVANLLKVASNSSIKILDVLICGDPGTDKTTLRNILCDLPESHFGATTKINGILDPTIINSKGENIGIIYWETPTGFLTETVREELISLYDFFIKMKIIILDFSNPNVLEKTKELPENLIPYLVLGNKIDSIPLRKRNDLIRSIRDNIPSGRLFLLMDKKDSNNIRDNILELINNGTIDLNSLKEVKTSEILNQDIIYVANRQSL